MNEKETANMASRCSRCSVSLLAEYAFCTNCGEHAKPHPAQLIHKPVQVVAKETRPKQIRGTPGNRIAAKVQRKTSSLEGLTHSGVLSLPSAVISKLDQLLAKPVLDDAMFTKRMVQQFQTQILEMRNAEDIEIATQNKYSSSLALDAPSIEGNSKYGVEPPSHYYSSSAQRDVMETTTSAPTKKSMIVSKPPSDAVGKYLDNVESISTHYNAYLQRLKQLEGLRAAMMEPPTMPTELLQNRSSNSRQVHTTVASNGEKNGMDMDMEKEQSKLSSAEVVHEPSAHAGSQVTTTTDAPDPVNTEVPSHNTGMAFMWGPIFNPGGSVADDTIYSAIAERKSVVYLDADAIINESRGSSRKNNLSRGSRQGSSRASSPFKESFLCEKSGTSSPVSGRSEKYASIANNTSSSAAQDLPTKSSRSPSSPCSPSQTGSADKQAISARKDHQQAAAPVVMFWGNVLQAEQDEEEDEENGMSTPGGSRKYFSRAGSFLSQHSVHSIAEMQAYEESELPVWIETLAAETAELREEFSQEDAEIMQQVSERLNTLDAEGLRLQSQRALLVQYSMDGVVKQYWERMQLFKAGMRLQSTPLKLLGYTEDNESPGWSDDESDSNKKDEAETEAGGVPLLTASTELQDDRRAPTEAEESVRVESLQNAQHHIAPTDKTASLTTLSSGTPSESFYPVRVDRGAVLHKHEKEEFRDAVNREKLQVRDEEMMQELILELARSHQSMFEAADNSNIVPASGNAPSGTVGLKTLELKRSMVPEMPPPQTTAEERVSSLLQAWESQEDRERETRDRLQESDDLALQQWLVAVSATDRDRATRQTLRTLQLEELEDRAENESDEDSVQSATKRAAVETSSHIESATIEVPENNSLATIKTLYRQSCSKMLAFLSELNVDFTVDQTENPHFRSEARTKLQFAKRILKTSTNVDHKVALEYRNYLDYCAVRRTALAMKLSEEMQRASQLEQSYRERYAAATKEFKHSTEAHLHHSNSNTNSNSNSEGPPRQHITSSKHMQAIKLSAEIDLRAQGEIVKRLQADEAKLLLDTRQEQFVLSEVLGLWQARHSRTLHTYSLAYKRLSGLVDSTQPTLPTQSLSQQSHK